MPIELVVYVLTGVAALGVAWTSSLGASYRGVSMARGPRRLHLVAGLIALIGWVGFLVTTPDTFSQHELLGVVALFVWWLMVGAGLLLLVQYLPSRGRHAGSRATKKTSPIPGVLVHLGMAACVGFFTYAYMVSAV